MNECNLIKDLLPLYVDDVLSPESKEFVEEHLHTCSGCQSEIAKLSAPVIQEESVAGNLKKIRKKTRLRATLISVCSVFLAALLLVTAQLAYMDIRAYQTRRSFREYVLTNSAFDEERWGDDMFLRNPYVWIEKTEPEEIFEYMPDESDAELQRKVSFPKFSSSQYTDIHGNIHDGATSVSVSISKNNLYRGMITNKVGSPESAHYDTFLQYCEKKALYDDIELSRFFIEYPLAQLTKKTEYSELEIAYVVQRMRPYTGSLESHGIETKDGTVYVPHGYFPLKGWVNGYALFTTWLASEDGDFEDFGYDEVPAGMKRVGSWYINLQMGDHVCELRIRTTDMDASYFASEEALWDFLGGFRWSITQGNHNE